MQVGRDNVSAILLPQDQLLPEIDEFNLHINVDY